MPDRGSTMQPLFTAEGLAALAALLRERPLLAFDFDGTLAPIVPRPDDARISEAVARRLRQLSTLLPVAIVTGRAIDDVRARLGFVPRHIVGSHGAEDDAGVPADTLAARHRLDPLRRRLAQRRAELEALGVQVEDKGLSLALHYRLSRQRPAARVLIDEVLGGGDASLRRFGGKLVENVVPVGLPDKADAVRRLVKRCAAHTAFFAGDDINDEPVFETAPPQWLTVRVGRDAPLSRARYCIGGPAEVGLLLDRMLALLSGLAGGASLPPRDFV